MGVKIKVNLSKKKRKIPQHPDLTMKDLEKLSNFMISQNKTEALKLPMTVHWYQRHLVGEQGRG